MQKYLYVILDQNGDIVDFDCTLENTLYTKNEIIGKNWFDLFINPVDKKKIFQVFQQILQGKEQEYRTYKNDIYCYKEQQHRFIDFYNILTIKEGNPYTLSVGMEHFEADMAFMQKKAQNLLKEFMKK